MVAAPSQSNNVVIKSISRPTVVTAPKPVTSVRAAQPPITKTITMAQAQQMGLLGPGGRIVSREGARVINGTPQARVVTKPVTSDSPKIIQLAQPTSAMNRVVTVSKVKPPDSSPVQYIEMVPKIIKTEPTYRVSNQTAERLVQLQGSVVMPGSSQSKVVLLPPDYINQLTAAKDEEVAQDDDQTEVADDEEDIIIQALSPSPADLLGEFRAAIRPCAIIIF